MPLYVSHTQLKILQPLPNTPNTVESVMDPHATTESATHDVMPIPTTPTTEESVMDPPATSDLVMVCLPRFITTLWS